jgi:hypothetical protein
VDFQITPRRGSVILKALPEWLNDIFLSINRSTDSKRICHVHCKRVDQKQTFIVEEQQSKRRVLFRINKEQDSVTAIFEEIPKPDTRSYLVPKYQSSIAGASGGIKFMLNNKEDFALLTSASVEHLVLLAEQSPYPLKDHDKIRYSNQWECWARPNGRDVVFGGQLVSYRISKDTPTCVLILKSNKPGPNNTHKVELALADLVGIRIKHPDVYVLYRPGKKAVVTSRELLDEFYIDIDVQNNRKQA